MPPSSPLLTEIVLFDVEGSLVDCVPQTLQSWHEVLAHYGYEVPLAQLQRYSGMDTGDMLAELLPASLRPRASNIGDAQGEHYREKYLPRVRGFPRVRELLQKVKEYGCRIGLANKLPAGRARGLFETYQHPRSSRCHRLRRRCEKIKPHPDLLEAVLRKLNASGDKDAIVIGDTPYDAQAARGLGLASVGLLCGGHPADDLRAAGCRAVYDNPAQLLEQLETAFFR
jgi:phosphoglycolate phosphatase-like HAD superfamily hydrolase